MLKKTIYFYFFLSISFSSYANTRELEKPAYIKPTFQIQQWETQNQVPVYFVQVKDLPIIDIALTFNAGSARDDAKPGLAYLTNAMLTEKKISLMSENPNLADMGAVFYKKIDSDKATLYLRSVSYPNEFKKALELFKRILEFPTITPKNFDYRYQGMRDKIRQIQDNIRKKGRLALLKLIYPNHPYGNSLLGMEKQLKTISLNDVKDFYGTYYTNSNLSIMMVGDIEREQVEEIAEEISQILKQGKASLPIPLAQKKQTSNIIQTIHFNSKQTSLLMGQVCISPNDPDFYPLVVGNQILGSGALISRLGHEIRIKRGLAYIVSSHFYPMEGKGPFIINIETSPAKAQLVLTLVQNELQKFIEEGPTQKEVNFAQKKLIGNFPLLFSSNIKILEQLIYISFYKLPLNYLEHYQERIASVTKEDIKKAFKRHIKLNQWVITITGTMKEKE
ncbi:MAG: hypothetical protein LEGION0398_MBIBDBAK_00301 [Legionellaceae bacterium]